MCVRYPISSTGIHINSIEFDRALESLPGAIIQIFSRKAKKKKKQKKKVALIFLFLFSHSDAV
jgi:hypothetical protein